MEQIGFWEWVIQQARADSNSVAFVFLFFFALNPVLLLLGKVLETRAQRRDTESSLSATACYGLALVALAAALLIGVDIETDLQMRAQSTPVEAFEQWAAWVDDPVLLAELRQRVEDTGAPDAQSLSLYHFTRITYEVREIARRREIHRDSGAVIEALGAKGTAAASAPAITLQPSAGCPDAGRPWRPRDERAREVWM